MEPANRAILREAPLDALRSFVTPTSQHFVLAALGIPRPRPDEWSVTVGGAVAAPSSEFGHAAGLRRAAVSLSMRRGSYAPDKPKRRVHRRWRGVTDHVLISRAADAICGSTALIGASMFRTKMPGDHEYHNLPKKGARRCDVLLAYEMGDAPLPPEHGYPLHDRAGSTVPTRSNG
jgi:DMSO/TMAO reductase YedYZ molybdopterin-dependent catalytic subunit